MFDLIDLRSFSSLWFWLALIAIWTLNARSLLGVPYGIAEGDAGATVLRVAAARRLAIARLAGLWLVAGEAMAVTGLALLGFVYGIELAQALFLLGAPLALVWWLGVGTARDIDAGLAGGALRRRVQRHRLATQAVGFGAIFVTAMWGMYRNLAFGPLG